MPLALDAYPTIHYESGPPDVDDPEERRLLHKWECAIGYRVFAALGWGRTGTGHITARDPILPDHMWVLGYGIPFGAATMDRLVLLSPRREIVAGPTGGGFNHTAFHIHHPILTARDDIAAAAHTHTPYGTPFAARVEPFRALSQESCCFVFDQAIYQGEDLEVVDTDGGHRIAAAMGDARVCILRNHGLLTGADSPGAAVGWLVLAEQAAEVHVKSPEGRPISDDAARTVARWMAHPSTGWRAFQWLARELVPDPSVVL